MRGPGQRGREIETSAMPLMAAPAVGAFITGRTPVPLLRRAAGRPLVPVSGCFSGPPRGLQYGVSMAHPDRPDPRSVVVVFNGRINARDLVGLTALMTEDHTFVDAAGAVVRGRAACTGAWQGFFAAFPDCRNVFVAVVADGDTVTVTGHSTCSEPALAGPARWTATVRDGKVARWQVTGA